jgi:cytochrome c-type biogenesis protein CcmF
MIPDFGFGILALTFVIALYGVGAAIYGGLKKSSAWVESARKAMLLTFPLILLVAATLEYLLLTGAYQVQFVYEVTSSSMPFYLKMTALWGGQSGSLILWSLLMSAFAFAATLRKWERDREFLPWVISVCMLTFAFFVGLALFVNNPFDRFWQAADGTQLAAMFAPLGATAIFPVDGNGLNPLLRHPGMIIHPPMLYTGFVSFVVPFSFAIAALITGRTDDRWIRVTRRWTLIAWLFLTLGLVLGMRWAYDVLGWGGYWGWDPVENAALMPWLSGTAFLHSVMIQEKRGLFKRWNMVLILITYSLVIYGTFLTRSGVLSSVHAFAQSSIGPLFFGFIAIMFLTSLGLLLYRWNSLQSDKKNEMTSVLSRESFFLVNNLLFMGILGAIFFGVNYPLVSEILTGQKVTFGPTWYETVTGPMWGGLLILMGIAPLSAWGRSTIKTLGKALWKPGLVSLAVVGLALAAGVYTFVPLLAFWLCGFVAAVTLYEYIRGTWARHKATGEILPVSLLHLAGRNRRRYGGYIIHLGVVLMALGVIGIDMFQTQTQGTLNPGQSMTLNEYTLTYVSLANFNAADGRNVTRAVLKVSKNGKPVGDLHPQNYYFYDSQQTMTVPGLRSTPEDDLYVDLAEGTPGGPATFKVFRNPLVWWLWMGAIVCMLGSLLAAWPQRELEAKQVSQRVGGVVASRA